MSMDQTNCYTSYTLLYTSKPTASDFYRELTIMKIGKIIKKNQVKTACETFERKSDRRVTLHGTIWIGL